MEVESSSMETEQSSMEVSEPVINSSDDGVPLDHANSVPQLSDSNGGGESEHKWSADEVKKVLEITASTGQFWNDWEELKSMLYFHLKQVLLEYPEAKMGDNEQNSALGESYQQLVKRLEEALLSFREGPPFTLQRLTEILLNARIIYPNLSKLALALEKNLLVTSTLIKSTDPYPPSIVQPEQEVEDTQPQPQPQPQSQPEHQPQPQEQPQSQPEPQHQYQHPGPQSQHPEPQHQHPEPQSQHPEPQHQQSDPHSNSVENGGGLMTHDRDEVMSEVWPEVQGETFVHL